MFSPSRTLTIPLILAAVSLALPVQRVAADERAERVAAAYALALGRAPTEAEVSEWSDREARSVKAVYQRLAKSVGDGIREAARNAYLDVHGQAPSEAELNALARGAASYAEAMEHGIEQLSKDEGAYDAAVQRAYRMVIRRDPYAEELDYWKERGVFPYATLVGAIEDWGRRNQPGLMVTAGTPTISINSEFLDTIRLSPEVAEEARKAVGLKDADGERGRVVAPGAESIATSGGMHFVAVGGSSRGD